MWHALTMTMVAKATVLSLFTLLYVSESHDEPLHYRSWQNLSDPRPHVTRQCPCDDVTLCRRVTTTHSKEVFAFSVNKNNWSKYDWQKLTTVTSFGYHDDTLMCFAHSQNVRVVMNANFPVKQLTNDTARDMWVDDVINQINTNFLDGVNVDFESEVTSVENKTGLTLLVRELTSRVKQKWPTAQVSFDAAWSPKCIDRRCYDYRAIADIVDLLFVMSYDERSQIYGRCQAWANSAFNNTQHGIEEYLSLEVSRHKLVLGVPWYGYRYPCVKYDQGSGVCDLRSVPFRGVSCSDAAGREVPYSQIVGDDLPLSPTGRQWDDTALSPYFVIQKADSAGQSAEVIQFWYDDPASLKLKLDLVDKYGLRGSGMWNADSLNYSDPEQVMSMWGLL